MPEIRFCEASSREALDQALTTFCLEQLTQAIVSKGKAVLAVSGGSTPKGFFQLLCQQPLEWSKVWITLADERWVDNQHPDSNERLVRENLLQNRAQEAHFLPLKLNFPSAEAAQNRLDEQLQKLGTIDVLILGMGTDGHTASLFPQAQELSKAMSAENPSACQALVPPRAPHQRMTLTLSWLLKSTHLLLHITGAEKKAVLNDALDANNSQPPPIGQLIAQSPNPVRVFYAP